MRRRTKGCSLNREGPERGVLHSNKDTGSFRVFLCPPPLPGALRARGCRRRSGSLGEREKHEGAEDKHAVQWKEQQAAASVQQSLGRCCGADCWDWVKAKLARPCAVYFCTSTMTRRGSDHKRTCWRSLKRLEGDVELLSRFFTQSQQQSGWPLTIAVSRG